MSFITDPASVLLTLAAVLLLFAGGRLLHNWFRERRSSEELPLLLFDLSTSSLRVQENSAGSKAQEEISAAPARNGARPAARAAAEEVDRPALLSRSPQWSDGVPHGVPMPVEPEPQYEPTLQLLPGRLEPVQGHLGREIRFVRGPGAARYTIGRSAGPAHTHIQLDSPTTSRMHAVMEYQDGRWRIGNLSRTNRVVVNGAALEGDLAHVLEEGDHVELGELVFVFRSR